jgi:tetrahydromethanopterin S-methyltransferase subunit F
VQIALPQYDVEAFAVIEDINEKKQFIGNSIYPLIEGSLGPQFAGKITGMLLDVSVVDIDQLLKNQEYLNSKVFEAYQLLLQPPQQEQ